MLRKQPSSYFSCDKYTFPRKSHNTDVRRKLNFLISLFLLKTRYNFFSFFFCLTYKQPTTKRTIQTTCLPDEEDEKFEILVVALMRILSDLHIASFGAT